MEFVLENGWMAVRLRPEWAERRRMMALVSLSRVESSAHGVLVGPVWNGRQIAQVAHDAGFTDVNDLAMAVAVALAECNANINSHNDNWDTIADLKAGAQVCDTGTLEPFTVLDPAAGRIRLQSGVVRTLPPTTEVIVSRDVGIWEMNIPAWDIGTAVERNLYDPAKNAAAAFKLWSAAGWGRWASVTSGVVFDDTYVYRALLAILNYAAEPMSSQQAAHADRAAHHSLKVPMISTHQLHALYPNVPQL